MWEARFRMAMDEGYARGIFRIVTLPHIFDKYTSTSGKTVTVGIFFFCICSAGWLWRMIRRMKMISLFHDSDAGNGRVGVPELVWRWAAALFGRRRDADQNLAARALELALDARSL